jgi:hypothetical protein
MVSCPPLPPSLSIIAFHTHSPDPRLLLTTLTVSLLL